MSHSCSPKGSECGCSRRGRGAAPGPGGCPDTGTIPHCCGCRGLTDRQTHRPRPLFRSRDRAAFAVSPRRGRDVYLCCAAPGLARAPPQRCGGSGSFRRAPPGHKHPSPRLSPEDRPRQGSAGQCNPRGRRVSPPHSGCGSLRTPLAPPVVPGRSSARPARRRRACAAHGGTPRSSAAGGRPVPGWALRDGRVSSLRGQAGQGERVSQSRRFLGPCRCSDFARGCPRGGLSLSAASARRLSPAPSRPRQIGRAHV